MNFSSFIEKKSGLLIYYTYKMGGFSKIVIEQTEIMSETVIFDIIMMHGSPFISTV